MPSCAQMTNVASECGISMFVCTVVDEEKRGKKPSRIIMAEEVLKRLGSNVQVGVQAVNEIPRSAGGKTRFIINEVE